MNTSDLTTVLTAVGELLKAEGVQATIVVVGGASLCLLGLVERTTSDVDVIARIGSREGRDSAKGGALIERVLVPPEPMPAPLVRAIRTVARDFSLRSDWMNTDVSLQWRAGLPPSLEHDIDWRSYGALNVGLVGRRTLIALKLFAAVDDGPRGVHFQDLAALGPTEAEFQDAAAWVRTQDASTVFQHMLGEVIALLLK